MIGIVIPLKAKCVSKNWSITCRNLKKTVDSALNQTDKKYKAVVIGHDAPDFFDSLSGNTNLEFITFNELDPPSPGTDEGLNQLMYEKDRCSKILKGIQYLKSKYGEFDYWFSLDADDLIKNTFVNYMNYHQGYDAIIIDKGYVYFDNFKMMNLENEFSVYCGSSAILSDSLFNNLPTSIDDNSYRSTPFGSISHVHMKDRLMSEGKKILIPSERLVTYIRDNGENISNLAYCNSFFKKFKKIVKMIIKYKKIDQSVKSSFGIN